MKRSPAPPTDSRRPDYDAVVIGSGPNGLAAAITLARRGCSVLVLEAAREAGGGMRSGALTRPGFVHDICSAIHPMALASPFFRDLPLESMGVAWVHSPLVLAHPLDNGRAVVVARSPAQTSAGLAGDASAYERLMAPLLARPHALFSDLLAPPIHLPKNPLALARFAIDALRSARAVAESRFREAPARALLAGCAAHSFLPLEARASAAFGLVLLLTAHAVGWPCARGGSGVLANAMLRQLSSLGGRIETHRRIGSFQDLPSARAFLFDTSPRQLVGIAGDRLPPRYARRLLHFRHGPGVFKIDYALDGPIPWKAQECARAMTLHLGGTLEQIAASERTLRQNGHADRPYVILAQQSLFDESRAPVGKHTAWAYCHVPQGSNSDRTQAIESQIERFAPGFRDRVLERHVAGPAELERHNENYQGGDITGGSNDWLQLIRRPVLSATPYQTPLRGVYLCSSSTPPGGGVHGMCGHWAACVALRRI